MTICASVLTPRLWASAKGSLIDLNHASLDELMTLPGMTRTWAERIVRFRPYRAKNELIDRGVVTGEVYARIRDMVIAHRAKQ
ncbi:MAG TPA: helix-hairpin-helix domain-containing protein [Terracidiphilus sp.]|nr:helix-hairpin-helix domain-containing protein [Terracidiphilus sp.]